MENAAADLAFNARLLSAGDLPEGMAAPVAAMREDAVCFAAVLQGCKAALEAEQHPISSELVLLKRIVHRNKSQHCNSMHLRRLIQLRIAAERVLASGLGTIIAFAEAATHEDPAGGSVRGNTVPSRQLLDLLLARLVAAAVLSQRANRAARLAFRANEELLRHALFMPLGVTCLALSARVLRQTVRYREALAECHLRLSAVRARAPVNQKSAVIAPAAELMANMLAQAQVQLPNAVCSPDFEGQVACLRQLLGETVEDGDASLDEDSASSLGMEGLDNAAPSAATPAVADAADAAARQVGSRGTGGGAKGDDRGKAGAAAPRGSDDGEDEGVNVQDLGVRVGDSPLPGQSSRERPEERDVARMGAKASKAKTLAPKLHPAPHPANASDSNAVSARSLPASAADASSQAMDVKKKKKKLKGKLTDGKGLSGSGAAALAALAAVSPPVTSVDTVSVGREQAKKKKSESLDRGSARLAGASPASALGEKGGSSHGRKGREGNPAMMSMLMPSSAADDAADWDLWSGVKGAKRKRRDEGAASEAQGREVRQKKGATRATGAAPGERSKDRGLGTSSATGPALSTSLTASSPCQTSACSSRPATNPPIAAGSAASRDQKKKKKISNANVTSSKERGAAPKSASGIFSDLFPRSGGWGD